MNQATFIGVLAIVLWSVIVGLIRSITDPSLGKHHL